MFFKPGPRTTVLRRIARRTRPPASPPASAVSIPENSQTMITQLNNDNLVTKDCDSEVTRRTAISATRKQNRYGPW